MDHRTRRPANCPLTHRQLEVVALLSKGNTRQETADELVVSLQTVKTHLARIFAVTKTRNASGLVGLALREGWIT